MLTGRMRVHRARPWDGLTLNSSAEIAVAFTTRLEQPAPRAQSVTPVTFASAITTVLPAPTALVAGECMVAASGQSGSPPDVADTQPAEQSAVPARDQSCRVKRARAARRRILNSNTNRTIGVGPIAPGSTAIVGHRFRLASGMSDLAPDRPALVRRGLALNYLTLGYNAVEAVVAIAAGVIAGSVALVGFGIDSVIEVTASGAAQWRLRIDHDESRRAHVELRTRKIIGSSFLALALYVGYEAVAALLTREEPDRSTVGLLLLTVSVIVMPWLTGQKRAVASALSSKALQADATQTALCAYLSAIALVGVGLNALLGWWWADPVSALAMTPIMFKEGFEGLRGKDGCQDCA